MALYNICRDNKDPFYRYKMHAITSKIEGRGNGIRTAVVNTSEVARDLDRPPAYIIKYFGVELGASTKLNETDDRYTVNGAHDAPKLQELLDGFITKFVLCASCKNPETELVILKDGSIIRDCKACGQRTPVDMRHKLASFIVKNPPETAKRGKGKKAATASADVGGTLTDDLASGEGSKSKSQSGSEDDPDAVDDDELLREAAALSKGGKDDDEEWAVDMSEEAIRARQREVAESMAALNLEDPASEMNAYDELGEWAGNGEKHNDVEIYKKLVDLGIDKEHRTCQVIAQCLFTPDNIVGEIKQHAGLLCKITGASKKGERYFLGGIERFVGINHPDMISQVPTIFHALYEHDIVSEETFEAWGTTVSKKYVDRDTFRKIRKAANPFLEWLAEASEEEDSDEESD